MKATGIVRRIDDLGRIVIPKEIRHTLRIRKGDPLELFLDKDGNIVFKKHSLMGEITSLVDCLCESLYKTINLPVIVCNKEQVIAVCGMPKKECLGRRISDFSLENSLPTKSLFLEKEPLYPIEGLSKEALLLLPISVQGDLTGYLIIFKSKKKPEIPLEVIKLLINFVSSFLCLILD